ncbi:MAG: exodeoxyribonuclease VII small subunit [Chloroflexota bacterium]
MTPEKPSKKEIPPEGLKYEQAYAELEKIVNALESDDHPLEEALALFERGQALARRCASLLENAELKVQQLIGEELQDFSPSDI